MRNKKQQITRIAQINFLFYFALFSFFSCAKIAPPSPLREGYSETGEMIVPAILITGTAVENRDSVGVQKYDKTSWINLKFKGEIDTTSRGVKVFNIGGEEVPYVREWNVSSDRTELILKPEERLNYNTVYMLKISGIEVYKLKGEYLDVNRNGVVGEAVDDDVVFPFFTFKNDNSKGSWQGITVDKIPPFVAPSLKFLINGKKTDYVWTDVDLSLNIYDYTWEMADTSIIIAAVDTITLDKSKFKIVEEKSKKEVDIKDVDYIGNPDTANFGRVLIEPAFNLEPERFYILRVLGGISDLYGNKLGSVDSVVFEKKFKTFSCNYDSTQCAPDTTAPVVLSWRNLGPSFEVSFSELINSKSITDSSVYIPDAEGELSFRNDCGQTFVRYTTLRRQSIVGHTAFVTEKISDFAGNKVKEASFYFEREID
ncbi:hypothetical protein JW879_01650 [candidate division WOR-3 bacterium]|nr:hypothetical protein [candidate division WOR-3 bacterium]